MRSVFPALALATLFLSGCQTEVKPPAFDGERAFGYLTDQVRFGPRVPGTAAAAAARGYFYEHFRECGLEIDSQAFSFTDPYSENEIPLFNIIADYRGGDEDEPGILLMAHFDSRPRADQDPDPAKRDLALQGANDGASGVAVLLELAGMIAERPPNTNVTLVLVDGEDWGKEGDREWYLIGSDYFARTTPKDRWKFGIVLDLVGDRHQQIYREKYSEQFFKPINDMIWKVAIEGNVTTFHDSTRHTVLDDHLSLGAGGLPTVVLIDFDYPYWHTLADTPDKCSPDALANVGVVLARIIYDRSLWPEI